MKWYLLFASFLLLIPLGLGLLVSSAKILAVSCRTQFGVCSADLAASFSAVMGQPLFSPTLPTLPPEVSQVTTSFTLPYTLHIAALLRRPIGIVSGYYLDQAGYVYSQATTTSSLPRLRVTTPVQVGQTLPPSVTSSLRLMATTPSSTARTGYLDHNVLVFFVTGTTVYVDTDQLSPSTQSSLQAVLARSKINSQIPKKIDLRYHNPIVVY